MALGVLDTERRSPCSDPRYRRAHVAACNQGVPGGGWPKCGDLCAYADYRLAMPGACGALGAAATAPAPALGPEMCANPLPPGRYALKIFDKPKGSVHAFEYWAKENHPGEVTIVSSSELPPPSGMARAIAVIFTVSAPVPWSYTIWGCPNVVDPKVTISSFAPEEQPTDLWSSIFGGKSGLSSGVPTWVYLALGTVALVAIAPTLFEVSKIAAAREEHKAT